MDSGTKWWTSLFSIAIIIIIVISIIITIIIINPLATNNFAETRLLVRAKPFSV